MQGRFGSLLSDRDHKGYFYVVTNLDGKVTQHNVDLVAKIEPLTGEDAKRHPVERSGEKSEPDSEAPLARYSAHTQARTQASYTAQEEALCPAAGPCAILALVDGRDADRPSPDVGPRGGVYHDSASGSKVYQRH